MFFYLVYIAYYSNNAIANEITDGWESLGWYGGFTVPEDGYYFYRFYNTSESIVYEQNGRFSLLRGQYWDNARPGASYDFRSGQGHAGYLQVLRKLKNSIPEISVSTSNNQIFNTVIY